MRSHSLPITTSATLSWISSREPAQQTWPWLKKIPLTIPSTAWSSAASSNTTLADLPPSSSVSDTPRPASAAWMSLPTAVEPVKATLSMSGSRTSAAPAAPSPGTIETTPGRQLGLLEDLGEQQRASAASSRPASARQVLPQASAGASFQAAISSGKFHGTICAATPSGAACAAADPVGELVGPARVVEEVRRGQRHVHVARLAHRLAAVHRLDDRQLAGALLDQARDPEQVLAALEPGQRGPAGLRAPGPTRPRGARPPGPAKATSATGSSVAGLIVGTRVPSTGSRKSPSMNSP